MKMVWMLVRPGCSLLRSSPPRKHFPDGATHSWTSFLGINDLKMCGDIGCRMLNRSDPFRSWLE